MKKIFSILTMTTLLASQSFAASLCPTICEGLKKKVIEEPVAHCHGVSRKTQETSSKNKMPENCGVKGFLSSLTFFNLSSNFDVNYLMSSQDLVAILKQTANLTFVPHELETIHFSSPPSSRAAPIYLLNKSLLIYG